MLKYCDLNIIKKMWDGLKWKVLRINWDIGEYMFLAPISKEISNLKYNHACRIQLHFSSKD